MRSDFIITQWISNFSTKQIISLVVAITISIYIVWYVIEALEGLDPDFRPNKPPDGNRGPKVGNEFFDPLKTTPEVVPTK